MQPGGTTHSRRRLIVHRSAGQLCGAGTRRSTRLARSAARTGPHFASHRTASAGARCSPSPCASARRAASAGCSCRGLAGHDQAARHLSCLSVALAAEKSPVPVSHRYRSPRVVGHVVVAAGVRGGHWRETMRQVYRVRFFGHRSRGNQAATSPPFSICLTALGALCLSVAISQFSCLQKSTGGSTASRSSSTFLYAFSNSNDSFSVRKNRSTQLLLSQIERGAGGVASEDAGERGIEPRRSCGVP